MRLEPRCPVSFLLSSSPLCYALWNRKVYLPGKVRGALMDTPVTSMARDVSNTYLGDAEGSVWVAPEKGEPRLLFRMEPRSLLGSEMGSIIGMHAHDSLLVVLAIHGTITVYDLESETKREEIYAGGILSAVSGMMHHIAYVLNGTHVEILHVPTGKRTRKKGLMDSGRITGIDIVGPQANIIAYGTTTGKVCVEYLDSSPSPGSYVFKAHKKNQGSDEVLFPVTVVLGVLDHRIITAGTDGRAYLWDIQQKKRVRVLASTHTKLPASKAGLNGAGKIIMGALDAAKEKLALVVGEPICIDADPRNAPAILILDIGPPGHREKAEVQI